MKDFSPLKSKTTTEMFIKKEDASFCWGLYSSVFQSLRSYAKLDVTLKGGDKRCYLFSCAVN